jgi:hypothetical protein
MKNISHATYCYFVSFVTHIRNISEICLMVAALFKATKYETGFYIPVIQMPCVLHENSTLQSSYK